MPAKKYRVDLTAEERETLMGIIRYGKAAARQVTRARILLKADEGLSDEEIAEEVATSGEAEADGAPTVCGREPRGTHGTTPHRSAAPPHRQSRGPSDCGDL